MPSRTARIAVPQYFFINSSMLVMPPSRSVFAELRTFAGTLNVRQDRLIWCRLAEFEMSVHSTGLQTLISAPTLLYACFM